MFTWFHERRFWRITKYKRDVIETGREEGRLLCEPEQADSEDRRCVVCVGASHTGWASCGWYLQLGGKGLGRGLRQRDPERHQGQQSQRV